MPAQSCFDADGLSTERVRRGRGQPLHRSTAPCGRASASISDLLTYYNKNHFRRAGLDPEVAPTDARRGPHDGREDQGRRHRRRTPVVLRMDSWLVETQLTGSKQPLVNNENGYGTGETTEATFDTDQTTRDLRLDRRHGRRRPAAAATQATDGNLDHYLAMASQKGSITMETSTAATTIESFLGGDTVVAGVVTPARSTPPALDIGAAQVFGVDAAGKAQIGGNGFFMTDTGTDVQKSAAWDFMKWWNQEPQQVQWHVEGSYLPVPHRRRRRTPRCRPSGTTTSPAAS